VLSRSYLVFSLIELGDFTNAASHAAEGLRIAEEADTAHSQVIASHSLGLVHLVKGDVARAIPILQQTFERCEAEQILLGSRLLASALGYAYALSGRVADALPLLEQAVRQAAALRVTFRYALWLAWLGEAYLLAGRRAEALKCADSALERSTAHQEPGHRAYALRLLAEIHAQETPAGAERAEAAYQEALCLTDRLGMRPLSALCRLGLGGLHARLGRGEAARADLTEAAALLRSMEMTLWLPLAEALLTPA
jgi:tetratricopeptide (TPR) repeat protein